jgi:DNA-3-methyladenine glycosylase II
MLLATISTTLHDDKMVFTETITIEARAPFNFDLTAHIFSSGDKQIRNYTNGQFIQILKVNDKLTLVKLTSIGTVDIPKISVELKSTSPITLEDKRKVEETVKFIFNLNFDLCSFYNDIKSDSTMAQIAHQLYGLKSPTTPTVFEALVDSIIEQQISIKVAHALEERLIKKFGETLTLDGETFYAYPTPINIARISIREIQNCGLSERKAQYLQGAAQLIVDGKLDLEDLKKQRSPEKII